MKVFGIIGNLRHTLLSSAIILALLGLSQNLFANETKTLDLTSGHMIVFKLESGGSINVQAWDREEAQVRYSDHSRDISDYVIELHEVHSGLAISSKLHKNSNSSGNLLFELMVPRMTSVKLMSRGGSINIDGLEGSFFGRTAGGKISIVNSQGQVKLGTGGGNILVKDSQLDGGIRTGGGDVLVENLVGDFKARSDGGNVVYRNVRRKNGEVSAPGHLKIERANERTVLIHSQGGAINVPEALNGVNVYTDGGNIEIDNASLFAFAQTGGGDISIELIEGQIKAVTDAGEIEVKISQDSVGEGDIIIESGEGDILLTIPRNFSMKLDVELGFTRHSSGNFKIETNLDVETGESQSWLSNFGIPRKFIYAKADINGGLHKVNIRTTNGNVHIIEK